MTNIDYKIEHFTQDDLSDIQALYQSARKRMIDTGNPTQWGTTRPSYDMIKSDIENKTGYKICDPLTKKIYGVFALIEGEDPTYKIIENGQWLNNKPYVTIHRIASDGKHHGIVNAALNFALTKNNNVRIDTHANNLIMQNTLNKLGFKRCGIIYVLDHSPRIAYHLCKK